MKPFSKFLVIAAFLASIVPTAAFANGDKCVDCDGLYDKRLAACNENASNNEARDLCVTRAQANHDLCQKTCSY